MANETTQAVWSAANAVQIPYVLSNASIPANLPTAVKQNLVNTDDVIGERTETKKYGKRKNLGHGAAGTEGVPITDNLELTPDTPVDISVGENSVLASEITDRAIERALGISDIQQFIYALKMNALSEDDIRAVFTDYAEAHVVGHIAKREADLVALNSGLSHVVGDPTEPCSLEQILDAQITYNKLESPAMGPHICELSAGQAGSIKKQLAVRGGGMGGAVWGADGNGRIINRSGDELINGRVGELFGAFVFQVAQSVRDTGSDGNVFGAYYTLGEGAPDMPGNYALCPWVLVDGRPGITYYVDFSGRGRAVTLVSVDVYGVGEFKDDIGVALESKDT